MGFLLYPIVAVRLFLLGAVLNAAYQTNAQSDPLLTALLVAVWGPEAAQALASDSISNTDPSQGVIVTFMAVVQTGLILTLSESVDLAYLWSVPLFAVLFLMFLMEKDEEEEGGKKIDPEVKIQKYDSFRKYVFMLLIVGGSVGDLLLFGPDDTTLWFVSVLQVVTSVVLVSLLSKYGEPVKQSVWKGGSLLILAWSYLQLCVTPLLDPVHATLRIVIVISVLLNSAIGIETQEGGGIKSFFESLASLVKIIVTSSVAFEWIAIVGVALVTVSMNSAWWTSHVTFPSEIQSVCRDALSITEIVIQPVYQFTGDKDVQRVLAVALPEVAGLRSAIYRLLVPIWGSLLDGAYGKTHVFFPAGNLVSMVTFFLGPGITLLGLLIKVFPQGLVFSKSQWFWAVASLGNFLFIIFTQVTPDSSVLFVYTVLDETKYSRTYSREGRQALIAQCLVAGVCVALYVQTAVTAVISRGETQGTGSNPDALVDKKKKSCCQPVSDFINFITSPSLVLFVASIVIILMTAASTGSPIAGISFDKRPMRQPEWLVSTTIDKASALTISIFRMLSPQRRLGLLAVAIVQYGLEQINCWGCLCVPDVVGGAESAFGAVQSIFGRRRLLGFSEADLQTYGPKRRLLGATCQPISCPRGLTRLCIMDAIADGLEKLTDLTITAADIVFDFFLDEVFSRIPVMSIAAKLLKQLPEVEIYRDLDIFRKIKFSFNVKFFGIDLGVLPSLGLPSFDLPSSSSAVIGLLPVAVIMIVAVILARELGINKSITTLFTASFQVIFISALISVLFGAAALLYFFVNEARIQGYDVHFKTSSNLWLYAVGMGLMGLSLMLKIGEEGAVVFLPKGTGGKYKWTPLVTTSKHGSH